LALRDAVIAGNAPATLLLLEHEPVVTLGRRRAVDDLRVTADDLGYRGIAIRAAERGGRATYHGPGQLVGYVIARLRSLAPDVTSYVRGLEEAMIRTSASFGVYAERRDGLHGVWIGERKLGSLGIAVSRGVCWHGFSLNIAPDLAAFDLIVPCGLDVAVTAMSQHRSPVPSVVSVADVMARELGEVFSVDIVHDGGNWSGEALFAAECRSASPLSAEAS
jgi:lipoate-protein ligase B